MARSCERCRCWLAAMAARIEPRLVRPPSALADGAVEPKPDGESVGEVCVLDPSLEAERAAAARVDQISARQWKNVTPARRCRW
eukprot:scaffold31331_cov125-Isochrysis_galbana.AAC.5